MAGAGVAPPHPLPATEQTNAEEQKVGDDNASSTEKPATGEISTNEGSSSSVIIKYAVSMILVGAAALTGYVLLKKR